MKYKSDGLAQALFEAKGPYGNKLNVNTYKLRNLQKKLQEVYDLVEDLDDETFQALGDGETLVDDLDTYIHEIATTIKMCK